MPASVLQAFYLASSWLWCIGAFLPLLLLRDYGWGSLAVFALANIVGAAAFGWVLTPQRQKRFLASHQSMLQLFSQVTIAFQLFFVAWLSAYLGWWLLPLLLALVWAFYRASHFIALISVGLFLVCMLLFGRYGLTEPTMIAAEFQAGWWHTLLPLVLGFALSPYLDLTFHRAMKSSPQPRLSFTLGFGVFFAIFLCFVLFYSAELSQLMAGEPLSWSTLWPVIAFIVLQTAFTIAVHLQEVTLKQSSPWRLPSIFYALYLFLLWVFFESSASEYSLSWLPLSLPEVIYRSFLFFYGLVFPLYLIFSSQLKLFWMSLLVAAPAFSLGFLIGGDLLFLLSLSLAWVLVMFVVQFFLKRRLAKQQPLA